MKERPSIQDLVRQDIAYRERLGEQRYGTKLYPYNGRSAILDAYEEALDLAIYLRQVIEELTIKPQTHVQPDPGSTQKPEWSAAREHAPSECGWYCTHEATVNDKDITEP
jgi:hypothetical protein